MRRLKNATIHVIDNVEQRACVCSIRGGIKTTIHGHTGIVIDIAECKQHSRCMIAIVKHLDTPTCKCEPIPEPQYDSL